MSLEAGLRLGPYELVAPLGAGGMGEVWRARDPRLRREVAVKFLAGALSRDAGAVSRFEREARAAAALAHPGIIAVYDVGSHDSRPYLVVELLRGRSLRELLEDGPVAAGQVLGFARQIARALEVAHRAGIVHRDLKPENLFLTEDGTLKILDFGLATVAAPEGIAAATFRTESGMVVGTLGYLAPEQLRGEPLGPPADIFGLGCVLYECLTGAAAFRRGSVAATLQALVAETPAPLSTGLLRASPRFGALLDRCLDKEPARRPKASDIVRELETTSIAEETMLLPLALPRQRWWSRIAAFAAAAALVAAATAWWLAHPDRRAPGSATPPPPATAPGAAPDAPAPTAETRGTADEEAWRLFLRASHAWEKRGPSLLEARDLYKQAVDRDPSFARAWLGLADTYAVLHDYVAMSTEETFPKAKAAAERALALDSTLAGAHIDLAYISFYFDRDWARAEREFRSALALAPADAKAHQWFSELLTSQGRFDEALVEIRQAQSLDPLAPMMYAEEVWILGFAGRTVEAIERGERANLDFADFGPLSAYRALALVLAGRAPDARRLLADPRLDKVSPIHPIWLAYAEAKSGDRSKAAERLEEATRRYGDDHLNAYYRAYVLAALGRENDALAALALAIARREEQVVWMKVDPNLAGLRDNARFAVLLRSAGFDV